MALAIIPDTNALLHFTRVDQQDWHALVGTQKVIVLLTSQVLSELDKHRRSHPDARLRQRARELIKWIDDFVEGATSSHGVEFSLWVEEPNFTAPGLDSTHPDDRIIATAMAVEASGKGFQSVVFSDDTNLRAKLKARAMRFIRPPPLTELKSEPGAQEAELKRLKAEALGLRNRQPKLRLSFASSGGSTICVSIPERASLPTIDEVMQIFPHYTVNQFGHVEFSVVDADPYLNTVRVNPSVMQGFERDFARYISSYAAYRDAAEEVEDIRNRIISFSFSLANEGTVPASGVRVNVAVGQGAVILQQGSYTSPSPSPPLPSVPRQIAAHVNLKALPAHGQPSPDYTMIGIDRSSLASINQSGKLASWERHRLAHHHTELLPPIRLVLDHGLRGTVVPLTAKLIADELPDEVNYSLNIKVD